MNANTITEAQLLEALAEATRGTGPTDARTVAELMRETGFGEERVRKALRKFQEEGRLTVHRVVRRSIDGRPMIVPAYTISPKATGAKRRGK